MKKSVVNVMAAVILFAAVLVTYTYYEGRGQLYQQAISTMSEELGLSESFIAASPIGDQLRAELDQSMGTNPLDMVIKSISNLFNQGGR